MRRKGIHPDPGRCRFAFMRFDPAQYSESTPLCEFKGSDDPVLVEFVRADGVTAVSSPELINVR